MILGIIFGILFIALLIWLCAKYLILIGAYRLSFNAFNKLHPLINSRYKTIMDSLQDTQTNIPLTEETKNLIVKALDFTPQKDGIDRIIRFANAIFENAKNLSLELNHDEELDLAKINYNKHGEKLRHYVDVFPTSLMARFANIKFMDSLR